ncbi:hypothetical protein FGM00_14300 [Aggregatimonas sangjinii]|uniref:Uncharacterized protein n=1 Tax=Aggregatimonas sangjinii TaxID=2583587 RepID=A0A5B7SWW9_9FLAO|nr:hypothetical protein [Aggregatimonas sangjinii]QCX01224.1 hypothetical protein FGM00_14300 [Aggregatimonas sangjinii]
MQQSRFTNIRLLIQGATALFDEGKISVDEFGRLIDDVENDYNRIVADMQTKEMSELLLSYVHQTNNR